MRENRSTTRRNLLKAGVGTVAGAAIAAPYIRDAEAATTTTWKVQTSWPAGVGLNTFKTWANSIKEKTGGELEFKPFAAKEVVGDFELLDGVQERRSRSDELVLRLLGRQNPGDRLPLVLPDGSALSARVGHLLLRQGRREDGPRGLRQAGPILGRPHPSRPEHRPLERSRSARSRTSRTSSCACPAA